MRGEETADRRDNAGNATESRPPDLFSTTTYTWEVEVPADGCYEFTLTDTYGDGLFEANKHPGWLLHRPLCPSVPLRGR